MRRDTKLTTAQACFQLCCGAHICVRHSKNFKRPYISINNPSLHSLSPIGSITEKQFKEIDEAGEITCFNNKIDKYGNVYNYYTIKTEILKEATIEFIRLIEI